MSSNVQHHPKEVYLRTSEAVQCRVQSTILVPIFLDPSRQSIVGALEVVQTAKDMPFDFVISSLAEIMPVCLRPCSCPHSGMLTGCGQHTVRMQMPRDSLCRTSLCLACEVLCRATRRADHSALWGAHMRAPADDRLLSDGCPCLLLSHTATSHWAHCWPLAETTTFTADAELNRHLAAGVRAVHEQPRRQALQRHGRVL